MVTKEQIETISRNLQGLPADVELCHQVVMALIETNQNWFTADTNSPDNFPAEYQRALNQVISKCSHLIQQLQNVRREILSPDAIRVTGHVTGILHCCHNCSQANQENISNGKAFSCQAQQQLKQTGKDGFRFTLDQKGQIVEKR